MSRNDISQELISNALGFRESLKKSDQTESGVFLGYTIVRSFRALQRSITEVFSPSTTTIFDGGHDSKGISTGIICNRNGKPMYSGGLTKEGERIGEGVAYLYGTATRRESQDTLFYDTSKGNATHVFAEDEEWHGTWKDGKINGKTTSYSVAHDHEGNKKLTKLWEVNFVDGIKQGQGKEYIGYGTPLQETSVGNWSNGEKNGKFILYFNDGRSPVEEVYKNGELQTRKDIIPKPPEIVLSQDTHEKPSTAVKTATHANLQQDSRGPNCAYSLKP